MRKTKLAICFADKEYEKRFVKCFMNHYDKMYEIHIFDSMAELIGQKGEEIPIILLEGEHACCGFMKEQRVIHLTEETIAALPSHAGIVFIEKHQEVYKIEQIIRQSLREIGIASPTRSNGLKQVKKVGVFSLEYGSAQLPFCGVVAEEYGEQERVLLLDLQMFSGLGLEMVREETERLTIEDLLTAAVTGVYTKNSLSGAIGLEQNWEYVYPPLNIQCLAEATKETYDAMLELLTSEFDYQIVLINFGVVFDGIYEWMDSCEYVFLLVDAGIRKSEREAAFYEELKRQGKEDLYEQLIRIEMPQGIGMKDAWKRQVQKWRWGEIGDQVRKYIQQGC